MLFRSFVHFQLRIYNWEHERWPNFIDLVIAVMKFSFSMFCLPWRYYVNSVEFKIKKVLVLVRNSFMFITNSYNLVPLFRYWVQLFSHPVIEGNVETKHRLTGWSNTFLSSNWTIKAYEWKTIGSLLPSSQFHISWFIFIYFPLISKMFFLLF